MSTGMSPVRVAGRGPSGRVGAAVFVVVLTVVASIGVLGGTHAGPQTSPPVSTASLVAVVPPTSRPATPVPAPSSPSASSPLAPTPVPTPTPLPVSGEGVPTVTSASATVLSEPPWVVRSGIETLWAGASYPWADVDGQGIVWASATSPYAFGPLGGWGGEGPLARYDPRTGETATWSVDDDTRFAANEIVPSGTGGVWLVGGRTLRHFDGSTFGAAYDVGARVTAATEASDGSVWAATADGALVHLAGAEETRIDALAPAVNASIASIAVDARGDAWCAWSMWTGETWRGWLARYDGAVWRVYDDGLGPATVTALTALPDGSVWAAAADRLARFDGSSWTALGRLWPAPPALAAGPDGTLWVAAGDRLGRYAGLTWRAFASLGDLVTEEAVATSVVPTRDGLFIAVGSSLYHRVADRWQRVLAARSAPSTAPEIVTALLAVSRDEAWVGGFDTAGANAVWHAIWHAGAWSAAPIPIGDYVVQQLLRTPDGSLWATDDEHPASVLGGSTWTSVGVSAGGLALDRHGRVWVADETAGPMSVRAYALEHGTWVECGRTASTEFVAEPVDIGFGPDGTIWVVASGPGGMGLAHYAGGAWAMVDLPAGHGGAFVSDLVVAPNGDVWAAGVDLAVAGQPRQYWLARFDGRTWAVFRPAQALGLTTDDLGGWLPPYNALAVGPDGTVWVAGEGGLFRYDGRAWTVLFPGGRHRDVSVAGDGTVWVIGPSGVARLAAQATSR